MHGETVGVCRSGAGAGLYVVMIPISGREDPPRHYELMFSGAIDSEGVFPGDVVTIDEGIDENKRFLDSLDIEEVPDPWGRRVRDSLFDLGTHAGSSSAHWSGAGRFNGAKPLSERVRMISERANERARVFATAAQLEAAAIADRVIEQSELLDSLSLFLSASGLTLSIVPSAQPVANATDEPWRQYLE